MMGISPVDRSKLGRAKRHILTDKKGDSIIYCYNVSSKHSRHKSSNKDVIDNSVPHRPSESSFTKNKIRKKYHHLCLDREHIILIQ